MRIFNKIFSWSKRMINTEGEDHGQENQEESNEEEGSQDQTSSEEEGGDESSGEEESQSEEENPDQNIDRAITAGYDKGVKDTLNEAAKIAATLPAFTGKSAKVHGTDIANSIRDLLKK